MLYRCSYLNSRAALYLPCYCSEQMCRHVQQHESDRPFRARESLCREERESARPAVQQYPHFFLPFFFLPFEGLSFTAAAGFAAGAGAGSLEGVDGADTPPREELPPPPPPPLPVPLLPLGCCRLELLLPLPREVPPPSRNMAWPFRSASCRFCSSSSFCL